MQRKTFEHFIIQYIFSHSQNTTSRAFLRKTAVSKSDRSIIQTSCYPIWGPSQLYHKFSEGSTQYLKFNLLDEYW